MLSAVQVFRSRRRSLPPPLQQLLLLAASLAALSYAAGQTYDPEVVAQLECGPDTMLHEVTLRKNQTFTLHCPTGEWSPVPTEFHKKMCPGPGATCLDKAALPYTAYFPLSAYWNWVQPQNNADALHRWTTPQGKWLNMEEAPVFSVGCRHKVNTTLCAVNVTVKGSAVPLAATLSAAYLVVFYAVARIIA